MALGPIDLTIRRGEFFSVVGPSGCGKSTLLDVLCGLARPTSGSVRFEGKELHGEVPDGIGVVFQEDASMPWLTVRQNVAFGLRTSGLPENEVNQRVDQSASWGSGNLPVTIRRNFPAACGSGFVSHGPWCCGRG
jgi:NitT/TauT family transport system ATP-binding protein